MRYKLIKELNFLPDLPKNIIELDNFRQKNSVDSKKLLDILKQDPLIVANILKVAKSNLFSFRTKVDTLTQEFEQCKVIEKAEE